MPTVARLNVTPVKSSTLHHPDEISLDEHGAAGDHLFMFTQPDGTRMSSAAKAPLFAIRASLDERAGRLTLTTPDGVRVEGDAAPVGPPMRVALFDREIGARPLDAAFGAAVSAHVGRELMLVRADPPERTGGSHRVSIASLASVSELGRRAGLTEPPDSRRFRMLIELDGCEPHEEDGWSGRRVRLGDAVVRVGESMPRCVVTTLHPDTGEPDFPALDVLATYRRREGQVMFGVYGDVERPGTVRVGDPLVVLDD